MILRISLILLLLLLLPAWYLDQTYFRNGNVWKRVAYWVPTGIFVLCTLLFSVIGRWTADYGTVVGLYLVFVLCWTLPEIIFALFSWIEGYIRKPGMRRIFVGLKYLLTVGTFGWTVYGYWAAFHRIEVKEITFASENLPLDFDGYRILQFSDFHLGSYALHPQAVREIIRVINSQKADIICFTGDLVNNHSTEICPFESYLSELKAKDGVYSIMGNHDYILYRQFLSKNERDADVHTLQQNQRQVGWQLLLNENRILRRGNDSIALIGVENDGNPPFPQKADLNKALSGLERVFLFKVLLTHDPTHWRRAILPETDIQLTLSGHTHGMQLAVANHSPAAFLFPEWGGMYYEGHRALHVSLGLGTALLPMRLGAWPEITVITLHRK